MTPILEARICEIIARHLIETMALQVVLEGYTKLLTEKHQHYTKEELLLSAKALGIEVPQ